MIDQIIVRYSKGDHAFQVDGYEFSEDEANDGLRWVDTEWVPAKRPFLLRLKLRLAIRRILLRQKRADDVRDRVPAILDRFSR